jgi:hypothetical protein
LDRAALIDRIEAAIHEDVGRNISPLFAAAAGGLAGAVQALADATGPVGLITGFYVPGGVPPAAETDGPVAAALLAHGLRRVGVVCRFGRCAGGCRSVARNARHSDHDMA